MVRVAVVDDRHAGERFGKVHCDLGMILGPRCDWLRDGASRTTDPPSGSLGLPRLGRPFLPGSGLPCVVGPWKAIRQEEDASRWPWARPSPSRGRSRPPRSSLTTGGIQPLAPSWWARSVRAFACPLSGPGGAPRSAPVRVVAICRGRPPIGRIDITSARAFVGRWTMVPETARSLGASLPKRTRPREPWPAQVGYLLIPAQIAQLLILVPKLLFGNPCGKL
jgi:hypothetical protein